MTINGFNSEYLNDFYKRFKEIKDMGFVLSTRSNNTGVGKTFEDLLGKEEDNLAQADFGDIEIKSQRSTSNSYVTLFTKAPTYPRSANTYLRENFGEENENYQNLKTLHTSLFGNNFNTFKATYGFKVEVDRYSQKLLIIVKDLKTNSIISNHVYYSFEVLKNLIEGDKSKLQKIAYITAENKYIGFDEYFHFKKIELLHNPSFEKFLQLIENGTIMIDIRIGVYHNPFNPRIFGKTHDHGTGFRIKSSDFEKLFTKTILE